MKRSPLPLAVGLLLVLLLAACGGGAIDRGPLASEAPRTPASPETSTPTPTAPSPQPTTTPEPTTGPDTDDKTPPATGGQTTEVRLYFVAPGGSTPGRADPFLISVNRKIPATPRIALATLRELVDGPSADDDALIDDLSTAVPDDTLVLDVTIEDRVATVDLSREFESGGGSFSMFARLAQVVYTVTQFPTVDEVLFELDGRPVTVFSGEGIVLDHPVSRDDYLDLLPTVFVDTPAAGAEVRDRMRVTGMAAVFEATFQYRLAAADGTVLAEGHTMSTNGTGWGSFDFTLDVEVDTRQDGTLTVWEYSAKDGSVQAERVTPLILRP